MPEPPPPVLPAGRAYHTRCPHATEICREQRPLLRVVDGAEVACHHAEQLGMHLR